ncbi:uncharacterized protein ACN63O_021507, partial [Diretmus argenteus]
GGRRLRGSEAGAEDDSTSGEPPQFIEGERPRPQGSSPVEEYPEKYTDAEEGDVEHDPLHKSSGKKSKRLGSLFDRGSTPKMSKLKEVHSPESGVIVKTAKDGGAEGLVYSGGGKEGIFIKEVVPESPASKTLSVKEGDQILSATVYFDNVTYEDAIQILEHAQAYKVKLCLKRQPDVAESEPVIQPEVIPEGEVFPPEVKGQGKTKRHGDARISWPKFPSFGKGKKKSHFKRSHSSSDADEQRKLELSPTTSDTESPIKSQEALKGKKHKVKLGLKKKGRKSSSENQDPNAPTPGPTYGVEVHQTPGASDVLSPQCLESPSGETLQVYVTDDLDVGTVQHKVELIDLNSTLKTTDLTVALADQGSPSGVKSPDGKKKKKKEKSELKMRIMGKDKSHKQDAKAKSPKRLQTLGASIEIADATQKEKSAGATSVVSHVEQDGRQKALDTNTQLTNIEISAKSVPTQVEISVPKVDFSLDMSDVGLGKPPQRGKDDTKENETPILSTDIQQTPDVKTDLSVKLPQIDPADIILEEAVQNIDVDVEKRTTKLKVKQYPYDKLSKDKTQLPKREDIEIPGMEDVPGTHGVKEPKTLEDVQAETVQMSIDVSSVKEAVSKLPGFKLPQVDMLGVLIPEEITVIDANAQRISVKTHGTPTKVLDVPTKQEVTKFDVKASPEISRTSVKLPKINLVDLSSQEPISESRVAEYKLELDRQEDIMTLGEERAREAEEMEKTKLSLKKSKVKMRLPDVGFVLTEEKSDIDKVDIFSDFGIPIPKVTEPEIDLSLKKNEDVTLPENLVQTKDAEGFKLPTYKLHTFGEVADVPDVDKDMSIDWEEKKIQVEGGTVGLTEPSIEFKVPSIDEKSEVEGKGSKYKMPTIGITTPTVKGPEIDLSFSQRKDVSLPEAEVKLPDIDVKETSAVIPVPKPQEVKVKKSRFSLPKFSFSKSTPKEPEIQVSPPEVDVALPQVKVEANKTEADFKAPEAKVEPDGQRSKFNLPKFGVSVPKVKGPEIDVSLTKKDVDVRLPEPEAEVRLPDVEFKEPPSRIEMKAPEIEVQVEDGEGSPSKFKMPTFKLPKVGVLSPNITVDVPDIDKDITTDEPDVKLPKDGATVDITAPGIHMEGPSVHGPELEGRGNKFKMPNLGLSMPKVKGPQIDFSLSKKDVDVTLPEAKAEVRLPEAPEVDVDLPEVDVSLPEGRLKVKRGEVEIEAPETELDGQQIKFKTPKVGISLPKVKGEIDWSSSKKDVDVALPDAKAEVRLPDVELKKGGAKVDVRAPEMAVRKDGQRSALKFRMPIVKLPDFGVTSPNITVDVPDIDKDIKTDVKLPKDGATVDVTAPDIDIEGPSVHGPELEGRGNKFKMPNLGLSMPKVKGPQIDFSLSKKDVDVTLPEAKAEVRLPEAPEVDFDLPEGKLKVKKGEVDMKAPEIALNGQQSKIKMPKFGTWHSDAEWSSSKKDVDVALPEAEAEVRLPDIELKEGAKVDVKAPEIAVQRKDVEGSPYKFKMPTFKLPKFGVTSPNITVEVPDIDKDITPDDADMKLPKDGATVDMTAPGIGIGIEPVTLPKVKGPEIDLSLSKRDADVTLPEAKAEVEGGVLIEEPSGVQIDARLRKPRFSLPKFSFSKPSVKGPEADINLPDASLPAGEVEVKQPEVEIKSPEVKAEFQLPDVELKEPSSKVKVEASVPDVESSPSKFKMPTFKLPKFGASTPHVTVEVPDMDKDIQIERPELKKPEGVAVDVTAPGISTEGPSVDVKIRGAEVEGKGSRFKMPNLSLSTPKVKGPDADLSLSKKDVDVKLPDVEVKEPSADISVPEPSIPVVDAASIKKSWSLPRFSFSKPTIKVPDIDVKAPDVDVKAPDVDVKAPDIDVNLEVPEVDVKLPEAKTEVGLPDVPEVPEPSGAIQIDLPAAELDGNLKKPRFSLPRFSFSKPKADVNLPDVDVSIPEGKVEVRQPEVDIKTPEGEVEYDGQGGKFKMPKFGVSLPKVTGPEIDLSSSKRDVDVALPEVPDVKLKEPSAKVELKGPKVELKGPKVDVQVKDAEGSPSKFKMPTFKLPKFGAAIPTVTAEAPELAKDINTDGAELHIPKEGVAADVTAPDVDIEGPSLDVRATGTDIDGQGNKFKMPKFGISLPKVKGPEVDVSVSKKDVGVALPDSKADVKLPDVEVKEPSIAISVPDAPTIEEDAKVKRPSWSFPRISFSKPSVKEPEVDVNVEAPEVDVTLPEIEPEVHLPVVEVKEPAAAVPVEEPPAAELDAKLRKPRFSLPGFSFSKPSAKEPEVSASAPHVDASLPRGKPEVTKPEVEVKDPELESEHDVQGSKFKMPRFGVSLPKVKAPEVDVSASKKDVRVTLPEAKAEVKLPDVEVKAPSAQVEIKAPEVEAQMKDLEGSPSKFKMPTFKMPKFGAAAPNVTVEVPDVDNTIKTDGAQLTIQKEGRAKAEVKLPDVEVKGKSATIPVPEVPPVEVDTKVKRPSWALPSFSFSRPSIKDPDADVNIEAPEVDVTLPETKTEVRLPAVEVKEPSAAVSVEEPPAAELRKPRFSLSTFSFSKPSVKEPAAEVDLPQVDVPLPGGKVDVKLPRVEIKATETEAELEAKAGVRLPDFDLKGTSAKLDSKATETEVQLKNAEGSPQKFKMPMFKLPKFGVGSPNITADVPDTNMDIRIEGADVRIPEDVADVPTLPEAKSEVRLPDVEVEERSGAASIEPPPVELDAKLKKPRFSLPSFSFSRQSVKEAEVNINLPEVDVKGPEIDVNLPEKDADVTLPEAGAKLGYVEVSVSVPEAQTIESEAKLKKPMFSLPRFSLSKQSLKEPEVDINLPYVDDTPSEGKAEVEVQRKDSEGSPSKFKMPMFSLPKFGMASPNVTADAPEGSRDISVDGLELKTPKEEAGVDIKVPSVDIKADVGHPKPETSSLDSEAPKAEVDGEAQGSPSKFKLPLFKMPRLSFSKAKPEDENVHGDAESEHKQSEIEVEGKPPKLTLTSFGEILKTIDVEFDVPTIEEVDEKPQKEVVGPDEVKAQPVTEQKGDEMAEIKSKPKFKFPRLSFSRSPEETETAESTNVAETTGSGKQAKESDPVKSPERTGWLKFPMFGLSSPSEPTKISEREEHESEKSPEDVSTTCSVRSSDAFADISSTVTSEQVGFSLSSPTKVTVKYSDPDATMGFGETHGNIITSTTRTELISVEPDLPEKITILSSGASSSSIDTLKLESGKLHVFKSNIQATPQAHHAALLTEVQVQPAGRTPLKPGTREGAAFKSQIAKRTVVQRSVVRETSSQSRGTVVTTKRTTRVVGGGAAQPDDTAAASVQRLKDSVHTEKMKFFDRAKK